MAIDKQLLWDEVTQGETLVRGVECETEISFSRSISIGEGKYKILKIITKKEGEDCPSIICSYEDRGTEFLYRRNGHGEIWDAHADTLTGLRGLYVKQHRNNSH